MPTGDAKALVREYVEEVWNRGDSTAFDALTTPSYTYYLGGQPGRDRASMKQFIAMIHAAFPDWRVQTAQVIAEG